MLVHLNIRTSTDPKWNPSKTDWAEILRRRLADLPFAHDVVIMYDHEAGIYDRHSSAYLREPGLMQRHTEELAKDLEAQIPDPEFEGLLNLDYEGAWWVNDGPFERAFFYTTIKTLRAIRPKARFGWWARPLNWQSGEYERPNSPEKVANDEAAFFYSQLAVLMPVLYQKKIRLGPGVKRDNWDQWEDHEHDTYLRSTLNEAVRLAEKHSVEGKRKPVHAWCWWMREVRPGSPYGGQVTFDEARATVQHALKAGIDGLVLWEDLYSDWQARALEAWIRGVWAPACDCAGMAGWAAVS